MRILTIISCLIILAIYTVVGVKPANASSQCTTANPESKDAVFECVATATLNRVNNLNPFTNINDDNCYKLKATYQSVLAAHGVKRQDLVGKTPSCRVFAQVMTDLNGETPYWEACLDYTPGVKHMTRCLVAMAKSKHVGNAFTKAAQQLNCQTGTMIYEMQLAWVSDEPRASLPKNYQKVDCDTFLSQIAKAFGVDNATQHPCAGFSASNINAHAKTCLLADEKLNSTAMPLSCQMLRQTYQTNVIQVYGKVPEGFRMLSCSVLNPIRDQILAKRQGQ